MERLEEKAEEKDGPKLPPDTIFQCLHAASEVAKLIDKNGQKQQLEEFKQTVTAARSTLSPFLNNEIATPAFKLFVLCLADTLNKALNLMQHAHDREMIREEKIKLFRLDFLLKQQTDQFAAHFIHNATPEIITDPQGRAFWTKYFDATMVVVPWRAFFNLLQKHLDVTITKENEKLLASFLDFGRDGVVSIYEFSLFLMWFGPLVGSINRLVDAVTAKHVCGFIPAVEANQMLDEKKVGSYLIRFSKTQPSAFAVTFIDKGHNVKHCLLHHVPPCGMTLKNPPDVYRSLADFVAAHDSKLKQSQCTKWIPEAIPIFKDNYFPEVEIEEKKEGKEEKKEEKKEENCVVCLDGAIETVFLECGHLCCCKVCSHKVRNCPLCRGRITRVVNIYSAH